jgi:hypothetical protein
MVTKGTTEAQLRAQARQKGYGGLLESGVTKLLEGRTTAEEVLSVTFSEDIGDIRAEQQEKTVATVATGAKVASAATLANIASVASVLRPSKHSV